MKFKKTKDDGNVLGFEIIEILQFNYDGKGSAIVKNDGELMTYKLVSCQASIDG